MSEGLMYKGYRIHTLRLPSGFWIVSVVALTKQDGMPSPTNQVTHVAGKYVLETQAIRAAKTFLDQQESCQAGA